MSAAAAIRPFPSPRELGGRPPVQPQSSATTNRLQQHDPAQPPSTEPWAGPATSPRTGGLDTSEQHELAQLATRVLAQTRRVSAVADVPLHCVDAITDPRTWHPAVAGAYTPAHALLGQRQWQAQRLAEAAEAIGLPTMIPGLAHDIVIYRHDDHGNTLAVARGFATTAEAHTEAGPARGHRPHPDLLGRGRAPHSRRLTADHNAQLP